ncbi:synapsin-1-like [Felis catus]|uniref:synapsin-1-like n=1 Tax=Felis catus TaxID=9685 RepID=UPI001D1A2E8A|nr:synapsin-1-like [Felis catus]
MVVKNKEKVKADDRKQREKAFFPHRSPQKDKDERGATPPPALSGVRTCQERLGAGVRPHGKGRPSPGPSASSLAPPLGQEPGPEVSARRRQARQGPSSGSQGPVRGGGGAQPPCGPARRASPRRARWRPHLPRALPQPRPVASPTWRPRRASRTSQRDPVPLGTRSAGASGRRETLLGSRRRRPVRRQAADSEPVAQRVTAARASRRRLSPTTTWRPRPPQEAGGRGGRRRAGRLTARPPARGRHRLPHRREPEVGPGAAPHPQESRGTEPRGPGARLPLSPRGGPEAPGPGSPSWTSDGPPGSSSPSLDAFYFFLRNCSDQDFQCYVEQRIMKVLWKQQQQQQQQQQ